MGRSAARRPRTIRSTSVLPTGRGSRPTATVGAGGRTIGAGHLACFVLPAAVQAAHRVAEPTFGEEFLFASGKYKLLAAVSTSNGLIDGQTSGPSWDSTGWDNRNRAYYIVPCARSQPKISFAGSELSFLRYRNVRTGNSRPFVPALKLVSRYPRILTILPNLPPFSPSSSTGISPRGACNLSRA